MNKILKRALIIGIPVILLIVAGVTAFFMLDKDNNTPSGDEAPLTVTLSQYEQVQKGQSYDEVFKILGSNATISSEEGDKNAPDYIISYNWVGKTPGSIAVVVFHGGQVSYKTYVGLTDD